MLLLRVSDGGAGLDAAGVGTMTGGGGMEVRKGRSSTSRACVRLVPRFPSGWPVAPGEGVRPFTRLLVTLMGSFCAPQLDGIWDGRR